MDSHTPPEERDDREIGNGSPTGPGTPEASGSSEAYSGAYDPGEVSGDTSGETGSSDADLLSHSIPLRPFAQELRRRRVWRTLLAYGAVVFVLLQVGEIVLPAFSAPDWALPLLVRCCFLALPPVLALAWLFDITPEGIEKTEYETEDEGELAVERVDENRVSGPRSAQPLVLLPRLTLLAVTLAIVGGLGWLTVRDTMATEVTPPGFDPAADALNDSSRLASGMSFGSSSDTSRRAATRLPPASSLPPTGSPDGALFDSSEESDAPVHSLAVLPLEDFSDEEGGEYFTAGLHEELVYQLSRLGSARVLSRTSVVQYDGSGKTMPVIAGELGVDGVVEGSVFRTGDRVRITVQLIHGPTDRHLWANSYEGTLEDAIALQREVAQAIAKEIQGELFPGEVTDPRPNRLAGSPDAQEAYLKGRYEQSKGTQDHLVRAIDHYESALRKDSSFVPAYAGLAASRFLLSLEQEEVGRLDSAVMAPLRTALRLDARSPEARAVLLTLTGAPGMKGPFPGAESDRRIVEVGEIVPGLETLDDSVVALEEEMSLATTELGRELQRIVARKTLHRKGDEAAPASVEAAMRLRMAGDRRGAEELLRRMTREDPGRLDAWKALEDLKVSQGDLDGAVEVRRECVEANGAPEEAVASLARLEELYAEQGAQGYWMWRTADLRQRDARGEEVSRVEMARAYLALGQKNEVVPLLREALERRDRNLLTLWTDPAWDSLRSDPDFREILVELRSHGKDRGLTPLP